MHNEPTQLSSAGQVGFDFHWPTRLILGPGSASRVGELAQSLHAQHVLLVTDPGLVTAGHVQPIVKSLETAGLRVSLFTEARENPSALDAQRCCDFFTSSIGQHPSSITFLALGGGSAIDTAKAANFLLTNGGRMQDYRGYAKNSRPLLPMIAIPTTAGTGSECQSYALISDETNHAKMACGTPSALPCISILDPTLTLTTPRHVTAAAGIDAITHAVETAVTRKRNPISIMLSHRAFALLHENFPRVLDDAADLDARSAMLLGSALAGMAIEQSMLGSAHSAANPLTAHFNITHGHAVGVMLPAVVRFNAEEPAAAQAYRDLALAANLATFDTPTPAAVEALLARLEQLRQQANLPGHLKNMGVDRSTISSLALEASKQWTAQFNPRTISAADFQSLYESVWS